mmetsp:Transcript_98532/g.169489  ORF Transcript_98532/g.169489 Transcript_98532/m.169489 type:complete len:204 (+) Transcript_98532:249-860(+)
MVRPKSERLPIFDVVEITLHCTSVSFHQMWATLRIWLPEQRPEEIRTRPSKPISGCQHRLVKTHQIPRCLYITHIREKRDARPNGGSCEKHGVEEFWPAVQHWHCDQPPHGMADHLCTTTSMLRPHRFQKLLKQAAAFCQLPPPIIGEEYYFSALPHSSNKVSIESCQGNAKSCNLLNRPIGQETVTHLTSVGIPLQRQRNLV